MLSALSAAVVLAGAPPAQVAQAGPLAQRVEAWLSSKGKPLTDYAKSFVRKLAEVAAREGAPMPHVAGIRSPRDQAKAMHNNYLSAQKKGGEAAGRGWVFATYGKGVYAKTVLGHFERIEKGEATFDDWHQYFAAYVKKSRIPSHTNGRAFDVTPRSDAVRKLIDMTIAEGTREKLFKLADFADEKSPPHFHIGLSASH